MAKQKIDMDSRLDDLERGIAFLIDQAQPTEPAKPARKASGGNWLITFVLVVIAILAVRMLAQVAIVEWQGWNAPPDSATQPATEQGAPMPNIVITTVPRPAQRVQQPQPIALPEPAPQPIIAQPEQPAAVAQPEPSAPQTVEARPTSEQYIVQNGQFVLAAEPAPTVVPGSAGPGGSSGGSTWGNP